MKTWRWFRSLQLDITVVSSMVWRVWSLFERSDIGCSVMDVRSRGFFQLSGVLVYFILKSVVLVVLYANLPTFLSYHKLTALHDSELLYKLSTPANLWPHRNSGFHLLLAGLYQAMQTLSQSMNPEVWHHADIKLYCSHGNPGMTHWLIQSQTKGMYKADNLSCYSSDSLLRGSCPSLSATDPPWSSLHLAAVVNLLPPTTTLQ